MSADDQKLEALLDELERIQAAGETLPSIAALAARHGLEEEAVQNVLAGLDAVGDLAADPEPVGPAPSIGDDYELGEELGRGGMGVVYRARQRSLDRDVAVKVLRPGQLVFGEALERFDRETRALAKLRHPNIAAIHEVGRAEGELYFTMDLIEGGTLADLIKAQRRPLPFAFAVELVRKVAGAIGFVHRHGLVHRDLKPANVLLDEDQEPFVVDFGLAVDMAGGHTLTATGRLLGTPAYMAPEQARGERAQVTERTDIYALGVMLYELVCGEAPFQGKGLVDTIHAVVHDEPRAPRRVRKDVPPALENVILKAMAKDPAARYGTAEALAEDLRRFASGEPIAAAPPAFGAGLKRALTRHRGAILGILVGAAAAAFPLVFQERGGLRTDAAERLATVRELQLAGTTEIANRMATAAREDLLHRGSWTEEEEALVFEGLLAELSAMDALTPTGGPPRKRVEQMLDWLDRFEEAGGEPLRRELLLEGMRERRWAVPAPRDRERRLEKLLDLVPDSASSVQILQNDGGSRRRLDGLFGPWWDRSDHPLLGLLEHLEGELEGGYTVRGREIEAVARLRIAAVERMESLPGTPRADELALVDPATLMGIQPGRLSDRSLERIESLLLGDNKDAAFAAYDTLTELIELPSLAVRVVEVLGPKSSRVVDAFLPNKERLRALLSLARRGPDLSLEERRRAEAKWLAETVLSFEDDQGGMKVSDVTNWFLLRTGKKAPFMRAEFLEWWEHAKSESALESLSQRLGISPETKIEDAVEQMNSARFSKYAWEYRWFHEWLSLRLDGLGERGPWWPWMHYGTPGTKNMGRTAARVWQSRASGEQAEVAVFLAAIRWIGGNGPAEIVWQERQDPGARGRSADVHLFDLPGRRVEWTEPSWNLTRIGGRVEMERQRKRGGGRSYLPEAATHVVLRHSLQAASAPSGPAVVVDAGLGWFGESGAMRPLNRVHWGRAPTIEAGGVRVVNEIFNRDLGGSGLRVSVLALAFPKGGAAPPTTVKEWTLRLLDSIERAVDESDETLTQVGEKDIEGAARLVYGLRDDAEVVAAARRVVSAVIRSLDRPANTRLVGGAQYVAGNSDPLQAALSMQAIVGDGLGGPIADRLRRWSARMAELLPLAERLVLLDDQAVNSVASASIESGFRDQTLDELRAIDATGRLGPMRKQQLWHADREGSRAAARPWFAAATALMLLLTSLGAGGKRGVLVGAAVWAAGAALLYLLIDDLALNGLVLVPVIGFVLVAAAARGGLRPWHVLPVVVAIGTNWVSNGSIDRAAMDAATMFLAVTACLLHVWRARRGEGRGESVPGATSALLLGIALLVPGSISLATAVAGQVWVVDTLGWLSVGLIWGGIYGTLANLANDVAKGPRTLRWSRG